MHHQFKELADVDITAEPMEVGPTCHYVMGGVEVDPDTAAATVPGLFAAGEVAGGMHGSNRLGGNSLSDLLVFGRRAGTGAAEYLRSLDEPPRSCGADDVAAATRRAVACFDPGPDGSQVENPYTVHTDLQQTMNDLVGIIRREGEIREALDRLDALEERASRVVGRGAPPVQPRLAPRARPAEHGAGLALRRDGGARAHREPRRPHPRGPPRRWTPPGAA